MVLKERIKALCKLNKIAVSKLEEDLGFAGGYIAKLDKSSPNVEKINTIASYFNVTIDFLMGKTDIVICPICGFGDNPLSEQSRKEHEQFHNKFILVKEKYPFLMIYSEANKVRNDSIDIFRNKEKSIHDRIEAFDRYMMADFSLEVNKCSYDIEYLSYDEFCKVEVSTLEVDWVISEELIDMLIEKYGIDRDYMLGNEQILARTSQNPQLMRILSYAEKLNPGMLDALEVQIKALAENSNNG